MKGLGLLLAAAVIFAVAGLAMAADSKTGSSEHAVKALEGTVVSVGTDSVTVKPHHGDNVTVTTDAKTKVTVDGNKEAKLADIKATMKVRITPATGTAAEITATTAKKDSEHKAAPKADSK